jgi:hypothetical protein
MGTRFWDTFGGRQPEPPVQHCQDCFAIRVPCQHDAFSFQVIVREVWSRAGRTDDLEWAVAARKDSHRATVRRRLRLISRRYPPAASALLEHSANEKLGQPELVADEPGLTCTCSFEATPDKALMDKLQKAEHARLEAEAGHEATTRNLERLEQIQGRWLAFLRQLGHDPLGPAIAKLAGDEALAKAIAEFAAQREKNTKELRDLYDTATEAYREKGIYEFARTTDNALNRLLDHISPQAAPSPNGNGQNGHGPHPAH